MVEQQAERRVPTYRGALGTVFGEVWFDDRTPVQGIDVVAHVQSLERPATDLPCDEFSTLWIDLTKSDLQLLEEMNTLTRRHIRKAEALDLETKAYFPLVAKELVEFSSFFDEFAERAALPGTDQNKLRMYSECENLDGSCIRYQGRTLVWHLYFRTNKVARLLHSATAPIASEQGIDAGLISKANRLLHWRDMLRWRNQGLAVFDFGGIYQGQADQKRANITAFKRSFGGEIKMTYNYSRPATFKGRLHQLLVRTLRAVRARSTRGKGSATSGSEDDA